MLVVLLPFTLEQTNTKWNDMLNVMSVGDRAGFELWLQANPYSFWLQCLHWEKFGQMGENKKYSYYAVLKIQLSAVKKKVPFIPT